MNGFENQVRPIPLAECYIPWWRKLLAWLPGFCGYCGRRYRSCHSPDIRSLMVMPSNGRACPNGHEGYVDRLVTPMGDGVRYWFDYVRDPDTCNTDATDPRQGDTDNDQSNRT